MSIEKKRQLISSIDRKILDLISQRTELVLSIGKLKRDQSLPIFDPQREKDIIKDLCASNSGPMSRKSIQRIFEIIIEEHRNLEESHT
jgi:chorismate mutase-like protein